MVPPDLSVAETVARVDRRDPADRLPGHRAERDRARLFLGLLAAANLTPPWVHQPVKWLLGALRGIPVILLALMFVSTIGLGPLPGVITIAVHATGMLGKILCRGVRERASRTARGARGRRRDAGRKRSGSAR